MHPQLGCHIGVLVKPQRRHAHGRGEQPEYAYAVRFSGRELWGDRAEPGTSVTLDCFESYLEADG